MAVSGARSQDVHIDTRRVVRPVFLKDLPELNPGDGVFCWECLEFRDVPHEVKGFGYLIYEVLENGAELELGLIHGDHFEPIRHRLDASGFCK